MKRLSITLLSTSACLALCYLGAGTVPHITPPPPLEAAEAAPVAAPMISHSENITTSVVSCLGDSITNGYPYAGTEHTYPVRLQARLEETYGSSSYEVINHGVDGYRADQVLADLQDHNWLAEDPDFVLLMVGGNDLAQETGGDPSKLPEVISQTVAEVQDIVNVVTAHTNADGAQPQIIISAYTPNLIPALGGLDGSAVISLYNSRLESDLTGVDLWFTANWDDFYNPATGRARVSLMFDLVHPNTEGYTVIAENWFEALNSLVLKHRVYLPVVLRDHQ